MSACLWRMKTHESHALFLRESPCAATPEAIYGVHENHSVKRSGQAWGQRAQRGKWQPERRMCRGMIHAINKANAPQNAAEALRQWLTGYLLAQQLVKSPE